MERRPLVFAIVVAVALPACAPDRKEGRAECRATAPRVWAFVQDDTSFYYSSPAMGPDGTVYVGSGASTFASQRSHDGYYLFAFEPDGTIKWRASTGTAERSGLRSYVRGAPALADDGSIYFVVDYAPLDPGTSGWEQAGDLFLYKVDAAGTKVCERKLLDWTIEIGQLTPAVGADGTVYVSTNQGLLAMNPDCSLKWQTAAGISLLFSPVVGPGGVVYTVCSPEAATQWRARICAVSDDGTSATVKWKGPGLSYGYFSSPALGSDGTVYVATQDERPDSGGGPTSALFALSGTDGTLRWAFRTPDAIPDTVHSSPAVGRDGTIYFGTRAASTFHAVRPDGTARWSYRVVGAPGDRHADFYASPAIGADGTIYAANEFEGLLAFAPDGRLLWRDAAPGCDGPSVNLSSPTLAPDGTLYVGLNYGAFIAVKTDSLGLDPEAPWPKYHFDVANSGRKR